MAAELSDADVFGSATATPAPSAAPPELSDEAVFGPMSWGAMTAREGSPEELPPTADLLSIGGLRKVMEPAPGYVPTGVLPFSLRETTPGSGVADPASGLRGMHWDWGPVRMFVNPLLDLLEGTGQATSVGGPNAPLAGKVSPEATALLLGAKMGNLNPFAPRNKLMAEEGDIRFGPSEARPPSAGDSRAAPLSPEFTSNPLSPTARAAAEAATTKVEAPSTPTGIPIVPPETPPPVQTTFAGSDTQPSGPRSLGAAASREQTTEGSFQLTPEQAAEYGSTADKQWLYKTMRPGEADPTEYVPGITPTMAQREQTVLAARETKAQRNLSPAADQAERELLDEHNALRKSAFQETAGSDVTQGIAMRDADRNIDQGLAAAFRAGGTVDPRPITDAIQTELSAPSGKLPPVRAVMKTISDALEKSDSSGPETDPRQVYGVRRVINFLQSKRGLAENPAYGDRDVQAALIRVKQAIDGAIEPAAPGFGQAIADYATAQRAIEAREAMQEAEPKLYDDKGRMQYSRFHRFMADVIRSRDPNAPLNPYQSLTEAQMNRLKSIHDDLFRVASAEDNARARGSDTAMNFMDALKEAAQGVPGTVAAGIAGHIIGGPAGIVMGPAIKQGVQGVFTRRAERAATEKMGRLLRPDPTLYPTRRNPLLGPDEPP